jgi:hypothetical protein
MMRKACNVAGCNKPAHTRGLCAMHKARVRRTGSLELRQRRKPQVRHSKGYVLTYAPEHLLSDARGYVTLPIRGRTSVTGFLERRA